MWSTAVFRDVWGTDAATVFGSVWGLASGQLAGEPPAVRTLATPATILAGPEGPPTLRVNGRVRIVASCTRGANMRGTILSETGDGGYCVRLDGWPARKTLCYMPEALIPIGSIHSPIMYGCEPTASKWVNRPACR